MNLNFDTATLTQTEAQAAILLLSTLFPSAAIPSTLERSQPPQTAAEHVAASAPASGPTLVQPDPTPIPARKRRTKAEMEAAAQDALADPTQGSDAAAAAASGTTQPATASSPTAPAGEATQAAKSISADELRALLNGYIKKHTMEAAIAILKEFGCNRVTEALALDPIKLNELASKLNA